MGIITPQVLEAVKTGFRHDFQTGLEAANSAWRQVATRIPSTSRSNTYGWLGQFPQFREWVGARVIRDMAAHGYQVENKLWESTVGVSRTDIEDGNISVYTPLFREMGRAAGVLPDELVFGLLKDAHNQLCFDGRPFFDESHPVFTDVDGAGDPDLVSNIDVPSENPGPAWYLLDASRPVKPLIFQERIAPHFQTMADEEDEGVFLQDEYRYGVRARSNVGFGFWQMAFKSQRPLTKEYYANARGQMMSMRADGGRPLALKPTLLVVPPALEEQALHILAAKRHANGATNVLYASTELLVTPWIS